MTYSSKKLAVLVAITLFTVFFRFSCLWMPFPTATTSEESNADTALSKKMPPSQTPIHSTTTPSKLVFFFLPLSSNETKTIDNPSSAPSKTSSDGGPSSNRTNDSPLQHHGIAGAAPNGLLKPMAPDILIDLAQSTSSFARTKPFLDDARPFQPYRQYMNDCGTAWWLWFIYVLFKMVSALDNKHMTTKTLRTKLHVHLPNLLSFAWISAHIACLSLRHFWTIVSILSPLCGVALLWPDLERVGRKLALPPAQDCPWPSIGVFDGALVGLFVVMLPSILFRVAAVSYALNGSFPWIRHCLRPYFKPAKTKLNKYALLLRPTKRRKIVKTITPSGSQRLLKLQKIS